MKKLIIAGSFPSEIIKDKDDNFINHNIYDAIFNAICMPVDRGATYDSMASVIGLIRKIQAAKTAGEESVLLESSEHSILVNALKAVRFAVNDPALFEFVKKVAELPDVNVEEKVA